MGVRDERRRPAAFYARHGLVELERTDGDGNEEKRSGHPDGLAGGRLRWRSTARLIDDVDDQLGDLLARRVALTRAVQALKAGQGQQPRDLVREREIADRLASRAPALGADRLDRIVHAIVTESLGATEHS